MVESLSCLRTPVPNGLGFNMFYSLFQAMCGVNLFSCLLTSVSLLQQGAFFDSLVFMSQFPSFTFDCVILSFCSAFGQVFIYHTIKVFGKSSPTTFNELTTFFDEFPATTNLLIFLKTGFVCLGIYSYVNNSIHFRGKKNHRFVVTEFVKQSDEPIND